MCHNVEIYTNAFVILLCKHIKDRIMKIIVLSQYNGRANLTTARTELFTAFNMTFLITWTAGLFACTKHVK